MAHAQQHSFSSRKRSKLFDSSVIADPNSAVDFIINILESSTEYSIIAKDLKGTILLWNEGARRLYGYEPEEVVGKMNSSILHISSDIKANLPTKILKEAIEKGKYEGTITRQRKDKSQFIARVVVTPRYDANGKAVGLLLMSKDISVEIQMSKYARSLIEASLDPLVTISPAGTITDVNEATVQITGVAREKLIDSDFSNYFTEPKKAQEGYKLVFSKGNVTDYPLTIRHVTGRTRDVLYNASVYKDERGNVLGVFAAARDITEQKQASRYARSLIEASLDPLVTISPEGKITDVNEATIGVTGASKEELIGADFSNYFTEPEKARAGYEEVFKKGFIKDYPLTIRHKDSKLMDVLYNASVYKDEKGNVLGVFAAARDITLQKQASQYARSLIEASLDPFVTISIDGKITDVNEATAQVTGVSRDKLIGSDFSDYFTEPEEAREGYKQVFKEGFVRDYPLAIRHVSGAITHVIYNATVYRDVAGKVSGVFAAARDITQRKKAEEQQHATSAYARSLIESSLDPLVTISPEGKITDVNHATELITGVTREWLIGSDFSNYFTEPRMAREGYRYVLKENSVRDYPLAIRHSSGKIVDVLYNATVYRDATGKVQGVFAAARDVTETKKGSQYTRSLIEASLDPLVTISAEGKITDVNEATIKVTGLTRSQLISTDFSIYFTEPNKARAGYEEVFQKGFVMDYPLTIRHQDGKLTDVLYNASVYKDQDGNVLGVFAAARDYSRVKKTSQQLESSNQELDAFTYSVAHDLKAPLRAIDGFSKILIDNYKATLDEEGQRVVATICKNTGKMVKLIEDLLAFSHIGRQDIHKELINTKEEVDAISKELTEALPNRTISLTIKPLPNMKADRALMRQVWINLISNAIKFTQTNQTAVIEIGSTRDEAHFVTYYVKDNGLGFDMKYKDKLFGVFQRLHGQDIEGTGIGLANVKRIIMRQGGKTWGNGKIGSGATFYFTLPDEEESHG